MPLSGLLAKPISTIVMPLKRRIPIHEGPPSLGLFSKRTVSHGILAFGRSGTLCEVTFLGKTCVSIPSFSCPSVNPLVAIRRAVHHGVTSATLHPNRRHCRSTLDQYRPQAPTPPTPPGPPALVARTRPPGQKDKHGLKRKTQSMN